MRYQNFPVQLNVLWVEKGASLVTQDGIKGKLRFTREYTYRSTNEVGGHSLSRMYSLTPVVVGASDRGSVVYHTTEVWVRSCRHGECLICSTYLALQFWGLVFAAAA